MPAGPNPFVPTFGASPPVLVGRDGVINDIVEGLETGPGHPEYTAILTGPRGVGKTVALNEIQDRAEQIGWRVIALDASSGTFLAELAHEAAALVASLSPPPQQRRVSGLKVASVAVDFDLANSPAPDVTLRDLLRQAGTLLAEHNTGLLITLDELHSANADEIHRFGASVQHVTKRESHPVAFTAAALPQIDDLMAGNRSTFLQRCAWHELEDIPTPDVAEALRTTIEQSGGAVTDEAVAAAAHAVSGYAFMVQLVGHHMWNAARAVDGPITIIHAEAGIAAASARMGRQIFDPQWRVLSDVDRLFLCAMAVDEGPSRITDIARRLERSPQYVNTYRERLITGGWIRPTRRGVVQFTHPAAGSWLRERCDLSSVETR